MNDSSRRPRFAFYGDDFTGSVDALLQFRRAGLSGTLLTSRDALADATANPAEVIGLAGISRSLPTADLADEVRPALSALRETGATVVQYKACSTGDSSPTIGSLGRVLELGRDVFGRRAIPVALAQPDFGRYTFFGHHFAADGDEVYRLDRQPTMRDHPITPAGDSDLRLHLAAQTGLPIGSLPWTRYGDPTAMSAALDGSPGQKAAAIVADAFTDDQLDQLAAAILSDPVDWPSRFVVGSGGISGALARVAGSTDRLPPLPLGCPPARRPVLVLSGSTSRRTRDQITESGWPVIDLFAPDAADRTLAELVAGHDVIVSSTVARSNPSTRSASEGLAADPTSTTGEIADALAAIGERALQATDSHPDRMIICGGDTAGAVLRTLGVDAISILAQPWGNAVLCRASSGRSHLDGLELVLKGGQMGHRSLFADVRSGAPQTIDISTADTANR